MRAAFTLSGFISLELPFLFSPLVFRSLGGDFGESSRILPSCDEKSRAVERPMP